MCSWIRFKAHLLRRHPLHCQLLQPLQFLQPDRLRHPLRPLPLPLLLPYPTCCHPPLPSQLQPAPSCRWPPRLQFTYLFRVRCPPPPPPPPTPSPPPPLPPPPPFSIHLLPTPALPSSRSPSCHRQKHPLDRRAERRTRIPPRLAAAHAIPVFIARLAACGAAGATVQPAAAAAARVGWTGEESFGGGGDVNCGLRGKAQAHRLVGNAPCRPRGCSVQQVLGWQRCCSCRGCADSDKRCSSPAAHAAGWCVGERGRRRHIDCVRGVAEGHGGRGSLVTRRRRRRRIFPRRRICVFAFSNPLPHPSTTHRTHHVHHRQTHLLLPPLRPDARDPR